MLALPCLLLAASVAGRSGDGDTARPARLLLQRDGDGDAELRDPRLDTRVHSRNQADPQQPVHLAQTSFLVKAFKTSFILDLELNQLLSCTCPRGLASLALHHTHTLSHIHTHTHT
ncbi:disintegrin and metalloproteinase domain-containing protein 11-like isoform X2 [Denticeps clupeoides]|uniref:disintegrin and metalloproteinase domain-containing protein 11-like isoform X2 n=1 Tax=Denticeps clupeoides TaxID=299321 RepID=UPI0010A52563|nr:disintegrin and metalloproteinase domain-containing protein 11-like isoform X2 [Denticeps clupeoides]